MEKKPENRDDFKRWLLEGNIPEEADEFTREALEGWKDKEDHFDQANNNLDIKIEEKIADSRIKSIIPETTKKQPIWIRYAIAASIAVVIGFFAIKYDQNNILKTEKLYASNFKPLSHPDQAVRGESEGPGGTEALALAAYNAENYEVAAKYYEEIVHKSPDDPKQVLFLGISYMSIGSTQKAINLLSRYQPKGSQFDEDIQWYLALAYLKNEELNTAKLLFQGLRDKKGFYASQSEAILASFPK